MSEKTIEKTAHPIDLHVGKRIRHFRWLQGITQKQLAEKIGVKFQQLQKYETGDNRVSASRLYLIAEALSEPVSAFFPPENEEPTTEDVLSKQEAKIIGFYRAAPIEVKNLMLATTDVPLGASA